jgi:hypothetical protein
VRKLVSMILGRLAILGAILCFTEAALAEYWRFKPIAPAFFAAKDDVPGYQLAANVQRSYWHCGRLVTVTLDAQGRRIVTGAPSTGIVVHVVGDSQVFGWGLSDEQAICSQLQSRLGRKFRVVNHGVPGLGPYGYVQLLADIPESELTVLVQTEENDLSDGYSAKSRMMVREGFLVPEDFWGRNIPSLVLRSYTFGSLLDLKYATIDSLRMTPIGFNPYAQAAAAVLKYRMDQLFAGQKELRGDRLMLTVIPWDGAILPRRMEEFSPRIGKPFRLVSFADECGMVGAFERAAHPERLFQERDAHLTADGAGLAAEVLALWIRETLQRS